MAEFAGAVRRREDPRLVTGTGQFVDDLRVPGSVHVAFVRSPHAHARLGAVDAAAARRAPGILGVFTAGDLGAANAAMPTYAPHPALPIVCGTRPLAVDRVRFVGEPVGAIVATDPYRAHDALDLLGIDWEPLPAVTDLEATLVPGAPLIHEVLGSNVAA